MIFNWIFKKIVTAERIVYIIKNNEKVIAESMKDIIQDVLEDEKIAEMVIQYTDKVYNRYLGRSGKVWTSLGGRQKGINYAIRGEMDQLNPFAGIIDEEGDISLTGIIKGILGQAGRGNNPQQQPRSPPQASRGTPLMKPI